MHIETMEKAVKIKSEIDFYQYQQREIQNRNVSKHRGVVLEHKLWDEIGGEIEDVITNKIKLLEAEFEKL